MTGGQAVLMSKLIRVLAELLVARPERQLILRPSSVERPYATIPTCARERRRNSE